ncbi:MAG: hypothetical protein ACLFVQ_03430 [Chitinispirillaceae bacterium]
MLKKVFLTLCFVALGTYARNANIRPADPTHYFFTPTAYVNPPNHMVIGLRELSYAFPGNLQLQASILDNIGRINIGAKFGLYDNMSVGAGLASSFVTLGRGDHGIPHYADPRLGVFLSYGMIQRGDLEMVIVPNTQIGERLSLGIDLGLKVTPVNVWSFIWEGGFSADTDEDDGGLYLFTTGGLRIHPPSVPFLNFDLGIDIREFKIRRKPDVGVFADVMFCFIAM